MGVVNTAIEKARALRSRPTDVEQLLWQHLRLRQVDGHKFRRQRPVGKYIVDFVCLEKKLVIEVDGGQHNDAKADDAMRDRWLRSQGYRVLRFWNHEVLTQIDGVMEMVRSALSEPPPSSSPEAGEEKNGQNRQRRFYPTGREKSGELR